MTCSGYMPPEYIEHGIISKEFDIFSLGVIIAKLMAGREDYFKIDGMPNERFVKHVRIKKFLMLIPVSIVTSKQKNMFDIRAMKLIVSL